MTLKDELKKKCKYKYQQNLGEPSVCNNGLGVQLSFGLSEESELFSIKDESVNQICQICQHKMQDKEHYNAEQRIYFKGRYEAYCNILSDMNIREDTRIRGMADAYNEIVYMLNCFAMGCKKRSMSE